ncbi:methyltransferase domain-containing protein, partial [bacterium]|nr:methyltransferase domain-containing protein [bacterium]
RFARVVGSSGLAIGLDIEDSMVRHMNREALKLGLDNYVARTIPTDNPGLDSGSVDVVFLCNTYHHITNREEYFRRVAKSLKKDGRLVIVDFYKRELPVGPPPDHKMAKETVIPEIHSAGFELVKSHDLLEYQYFLEFKVQ